MRLKTAIIIGFLITLMVVVVSVVSSNRPVLAAPFRFLGLVVPTSWILALALLLGFFSFVLWLLATGISHVTAQWIRRFRLYGEREAEERYLKGLDAVLGSRPLEAVHQFQRAVESKPGYLPALLKLGDTLRGLGRVPEAVEVHLKALADHPNDLPSLYALTEDHLAGENHEEAKKYLLRILQIQPRRALKALRSLRNIYLREGNWQRALDVQEHLGQARVMEEERAPDTAFTPGILYQIGADLLHQDKPREAVQHLLKVQRKYPAFVPAYLRLAEAYLLEGDEQKAVEAYLDGYRKANAAQCLLAMESFYLEKAVPEEAIRQYQSLVTSTDRKTVPRFLLGRLYYRLEMLDKADAIFREIEGSIGESRLVRYYRGRIQERMGNPASACVHYRKLIRLLNPFELSYRCRSCGEKSPDWRDYCAQCLAWDTFQPDFRDELMQEIQESHPIYYQEAAWKRGPADPSS